MKWCFLLFYLFFITAKSDAQTIADTLSPQLIEYYVKYLAADSLKGRGNYTPNLSKAAYFIATEFAKSGLSPFSTTNDFFQPFTSKDNMSIEQTDTLNVYNPATTLLNVIGLLPGKSKRDEAILFTAHYDHIGTGEMHRDSIYNGANDNASGTAALLALAHYFSLRNDNERTLYFCAFAGEELGLFGSQFFVRGVYPEHIKAVINIEMIGRGNIGKNAFFITGTYYSNLHSIMQKNLKGSGIKIREEPSIEKQLFKRSDNYSFALKGIPAHTIMSSDDNDACYHRTCDEIKRLDINNMTAIIQAIAIGCRTLVDGSATPSRINPGRLY